MEIKIGWKNPFGGFLGFFMGDFFYGLSEEVFEKLKDVTGPGKEGLKGVWKIFPDDEKEDAEEDKVGDKSEHRVGLPFLHHNRSNFTGKGKVHGTGVASSILKKQGGLYVITLGIDCAGRES
jgi:hypothetical protein